MYALYTKENILILQLFMINIFSLYLILMILTVQFIVQYQF